MLKFKQMTKFDLEGMLSSLEMCPRKNFGSRMSVVSKLQGRENEKRGRRNSFGRTGNYGETER